jgi:hypothetical protein
MPPHPKSTGPYLTIRGERHRRGLTLRDVAAHPAVAKVSPRLTPDDIGDIELGRRIPTKEQFDALSHVFGVWPPTDLLKPCVIRPIDERDAVGATR